MSSRLVLGAAVAAVAAAVAGLGLAAGCRRHDGDHDATSGPVLVSPSQGNDDAAEVLAAGSPCDGSRPAPVAPGPIPPLRLLAAWLDGADLPGAAIAPQPVVDDRLRAQGASLYAAHCTACHGGKGDGAGPSAAALADPPANFTRGIYELKSTPPGALPTDDDLFQTLTRGVHGTAMVPWVRLSELERWALVSYLKTLSVDFAEDVAPAPEVIPAAPEVTPARLAAGKALFDTRGCTSCHGPAGKGDGPALASLVDAQGRPSRPRDLTGAYYHRGTELADLYRTLRTGLEGTPMASFAQLFSVDDTWAVAAYVQSLAPARVPGPRGLRCQARRAAPDPEELSGMRIAMHGFATP